jgi:hypothetical protein
MWSAHTKLLQPHLWASFTLPPRLARVTKPKNIERAYARSLRPAVSDLWRQRILHPTPAFPPPVVTPTSAYTTWTGSARTCTAARFTSAFSPHSLPSPSSGCDAKTAPSLPTNSSPRPLAGTSPTNFATALTTPRTPSVSNSTDPCLPPPRPPELPRNLGPLPPPRRLCPFPRHAHTPSEWQVSLLRASDPEHHLSGQDRDQWIRELAPLAASFAIALRNSFATP